MLSSLASLADRLRHAKRRQQPARAAGSWGEDLAHRYLQRLGYIIVARNFVTRAGTAEADLVLWDGDTLVFVEVKTRATEEFGAPDRAVDAEKRRHIARAAYEYAYRAGTSREQIRFDLVNVVLRDPPQVTHFKDAFR